MSHPSSRENRFSPPGTWTSASTTRGRWAVQSFDFKTARSSPSTSTFSRSIARRRQSAGKVLGQYLGQRQDGTGISATISQAAAPLPSTCWERSASNPLKAGSPEHVVGQFARSAAMPAETNPSRGRSRRNRSAAPGNGSILRPDQP